MGPSLLDKLRLKLYLEKLSISEPVDIALIPFVFRVDKLNPNIKKLKSLLNPKFVEK